MLVTTTINQQITKEIKLPYYCKRGASFYRINEDQSVLRICVITDIEDINITYASISLDDTCSDNTMKEIVNAVEVSREEVEQKAKAALEYITAQKVAA